MGYIKHHAIIVTSSYADVLAEAHRVASEIFPWVSPLSEIWSPGCNRTQSFFIPPDGSTEGWGESVLGDERRGRFISYLVAKAYPDGSSPLAWAEIQFGDDMCHAAMLDSSDARESTVRGNHGD